MICEHCHVVVPDTMRFCPVCGRDVAEEQAKAAREAEEKAAREAEEQAASVSPAEAAETSGEASGAGGPDDSAAEPVETPADDAQSPVSVETPQALIPQDGQSESEQPKHNAGKKKKFAFIGGAILLAAICAVLVPLLIHNVRQTHYNEGVTLFEQGDYAAAQAMFESLRSFDDSEEMARYCENKLAYQSAAALLDQGDYSGAQAAFIALGSFEDAAVQAKFCENTLAYADAMALEEAGDMQAAADAFAALGDFSDAADQAEFCTNTIAYGEAEALVGQGDYTSAKAMFSELADAGFSDAADRYQYCVDKLAYFDAEALLSQGAYYDAYLAFDALGGFEDAWDRMDDCIQTFPETGETYHNEDYSARGCSLTIKPPDSDGSWNYLKLYAENGDLVSCVAIAKGDTSKIWLPKGSYQIKAAYGYGDWFGETDLFGDDGYYYILLNSADDSDSFTLKSNYAYTLTLRSVTTSDGNIDMETEAREDF